MRTAFRKFASAAFTRASLANIANIEALLERRRRSALLDVGCDDGSLTVRFARAIGTQQVHGIEVVEERAARARKLGSTSSRPT